MPKPSSEGGGGSGQKISLALAVNQSCKLSPEDRGLMRMRMYIEILSTYFYAMMLWLCKKPMAGSY